MFKERKTLLNPNPFIFLSHSLSRAHLLPAGASPLSVSAPQCRRRLSPIQCCRSLTPLRLHQFSTLFLLLAYSQPKVCWRCLILFIELKLANYGQEKEL
ncbi:hypothetical protein Csa_004784 [Cucumis sativus]|uniref:Uncharacterized protein n=1 Tax=Cucumis sativus TaxID=3659 RepID=A0A0A0KEY5_CUCSA|nr:hypothetical protein Csa_004784 [Cucumis sativus]